MPDHFESRPQISPHHAATGRQHKLSALLISIHVGVLSGCSDSGDSNDANADEPDVAVAPTLLEPLPNPPLTEGPSADDEPVPFDSVFHTVTDYALVRDTGPRIENDIAADLTEANFAAGLPDPEITVPVGVDSASTGAPYFEGLSNVRIEAGQLLELRYMPRDPEGELPGMYSLARPEGATFDDNFDGTKTLRWQTYQADIGITDFTVVAIDPDDSDYRSSQTVLIAVDPPSDSARVPDIAPSIVPVGTYTVRAGDRNRPFQSL